MAIQTPCRIRSLTACGIRATIQRTPLVPGAPLEHLFDGRSFQPSQCYPRGDVQILFGSQDTISPKKHRLQQQQKQQLGVVSSGRGWSFVPRATATAAAAAAKLHQEVRASFQAASKETKQVEARRTCATWARFPTASNAKFCTKLTSGSSRTRIEAFGGKCGSFSPWGWCRGNGMDGLCRCARELQQHKLFTRGPEETVWS